MDGVAGVEKAPTPDHEQTTDVQKILTQIPQLDNAKNRLRLAA
jgi:hypothetical protein